MLEPTPPRAAWRATPAAGAARRDPALFLQLAGVGAGHGTTPRRGRPSRRGLALVVAALVGRGLVASTPAHVRRVERLLEVLRTSQSASGGSAARRAAGAAAPRRRPRRAREPAAALLRARRRRARLSRATGPHGGTRGPLAITLEGAHLRAIARALAERGGRFGAAVAAAALATSAGTRRPE